MDERTATEQLAVAGEELRVADEELRAQHELIEELIRGRSADRRALSHQLASAMPVPLLDTDPAGIIAEANVAAAELLRLGTGALVGKPFLAYVVTEDRRSVRSALSLALAGRGARHVTAGLQPRKSGPVRAELAIVPVVGTQSPSVGLRRVAAHWVVVPKDVAAAGPDASVVDALAELATLAVATSDLRGALGRVAALAVRGVRWAEAGSILVGHPKGPEFLVATDQRAQLGDGSQHRAGQGPAWDAYATGSPTATSRLQADERWARLAAARPPHCGALAVPLPATAAPGPPLGVLVLYGSEKLGTEPAAVARAEMFAGGAAAVLREHQEVVELRTLERQLRGALESRAIIEQAKGVLMARLGCDADEAFAMLARASQTRNVKLRVVAAQLVSEASSARPVG